MAKKRPAKPKPEGKHVKSVVYGGLDGTITTFAVVAGVSGANLSPSIALVLGFANLVADGISMAVGDYLSTKSEIEYERAQRRYSMWYFKAFPLRALRKLTSFFTRRGLKKPHAKQAAKCLIDHKALSVDVLLGETSVFEENPRANAVYTFVSFILFGLVPLATYVISYFIPSLLPYDFPLAIGLTGLTLFGLGVLKVRVTDTYWLRSGLEMLIVGGLAAAAAYTIGYVLSGIA